MGNACFGKTSHDIQGEMASKQGKARPAFNKAADSLNDIQSSTTVLDQEEDNIQLDAPKVPSLSAGVGVAQATTPKDLPVQTITDATNAEQATMVD